MITERVGIITGGSSGIGRGLAVELVRRGYRIAVVGRNAQRIEETLSLAVRESGQASADDHLGLALDVGSPEDMRQMADRTMARYGRIDVLIASAGIGSASTTTRLPCATTQLTLENWNGVLEVNLHGVFLSNMSVLPIMVAQGAGDIVNICSSTTPHGLRGQPLAQSYSASKFAMAAFSEALAGEVRDNGVRVHTVFPGPVLTPLIQRTRLDRPFRGNMTPAEFGSTVLDLIELDEGAFIDSPHILPMPRGFDAVGEQETASDGLRDSIS